MSRINYFYSLYYGLPTTFINPKIESVDHR